MTTEQKHNPERKECPQNKNCTHGWRTAPCPSCDCPQPTVGEGKELPKCCENDTHISGRHKCLKDSPTPDVGEEWVEELRRNIHGWNETQGYRKHDLFCFISKLLSQREARVRGEANESIKEAHDGYKKLIPSMLADARLQARQETIAECVGVMSRIAERRFPGIDNCPMDPLKQCIACQERAKMFKETLQALQSLSPNQK